MTETAQDVTAPRLVHSGTYALYETPDGGRHLVYRRAQSLHEDGHMREISDAQDEHLPDIPPAALPLISSFLEHGFPPAVLAMLNGKVSPLRMLGAVKDAMTNGAG